MYGHCSIFVWIVKWNEHLVLTTVWDEQTDCLANHETEADDCCNDELASSRAVRCIFVRPHVAMFTSIQVTMCKKANKNVIGGQCCFSFKLNSLVSISLLFSYTCSWFQPNNNCVRSWSMTQNVNILVSTFIWHCKCVSNCWICSQYVSFSIPVIQKNI